MLQQVLVLAMFAAALFFLGRMVWRSFQSKKVHEPGCAKCVGSEKIQKAG